MTQWTLDFVARLGKQAADAARKTVRSGTVKPGTPEASAALTAGLKPASHVAPTRYGRKKPKARPAPDPTTPSEI